MTFVPLSPIPLKDRTSMIFLQYGQIDVLDGAFVLIDKTDPHAHSGGIGRLHYARTGNEFPTRRCIWPPRWGRYWSGSVKRVFASTLPDNPVGRVLISYSTGKAGFNGRSTPEGGAQNV